MNAEQYLKDGLPFKGLDDMARIMTDDEAVDFLQQQRRLLFIHVHEDSLKIA